VLRGALLTFLLAFVVAGCGHSQPRAHGGQPQAQTRLTVVALNSWVGRAVFHLACSPTGVGGDFPSPVKACAALRAEPSLVKSPRPFVCHGGPFSWWDVTISGQLNSRPLHRSFSTCWTPQMATIGRFGLTWDVLRKHLVPRRHEVVMAGSSHVFPPGVLRATDLVTCTILGHHLDVGVPIQIGQPASVGFGGAKVANVTLQVARNSDGSVRAICHRG
jgi:hypothetical protein